jgi:hypothetical protein
VSGLGARLPSLKERAGKYEFFVYMSDGAGGPVSVTRDTPIYARYKAGVPTAVLIFHILAIFASMALAVRTMLEAAVDGRFKGLITATIVSFLLGAFILGPIVQQYAFGVWWAGWPYGYDWTDNKVLIELAFWLLALYQNRGDAAAASGARRRPRDVRRVLIRTACSGLSSTHHRHGQRHGGVSECRGGVYCGRWNITRRSGSRRRRAGAGINSVIGAATIRARLEG